MNARIHRTLRCRPQERLAEELKALRPLPERAPDTDRRLVTRVAPDPHVRVDRNDYSLDPRLVGERVEVRVSQRELLALVLGTGELCARHRRVFAGGLTLTAREHAHALSELRSERSARQVEVEQRPLSRYDRLIPA